MSTARKPSGNSEAGSAGVSKQFQTARRQGFKPAHNNKRVIAFLIDAIISGAASQLILKFGVAPFLGNLPSIAFINYGFTLILWPMFYWVYLTIEMGATPGKKMMGLRIVREDNSLNLSIGQLMLRELVGRFISGIVIGLGYIWVIFNKKRKTWHDLMAGTRVVEYR